MDNLDKIYKDEITLAILDYLSGAQLIDGLFVLCNIGRMRKDELKDQKVIQAIEEINSIEDMLTKDHEHKSSNLDVKQSLKAIIEKLSED